MRDPSIEAYHGNDDPMHDPLELSNRQRCKVPPTTDLNGLPLARLIQCGSPSDRSTRDAIHGTQTRQSPRRETRWSRE